MEGMKQLLDQLRATNVTSVVHQKPYPAILPTRPELSQAGKTVLITGGGGSIGLSIGKAFVQASAATIIITGRRAAILEAAVSQLEEEGKAVGSKTKILARTCDMADVDSIESLWQGLSDDGINVEVYINNAASFSDQASMLDVGAHKVWSHMETNAKGPLYFTDRFCAQSVGKQKVCLGRLFRQHSVD